MDVLKDTKKRKKWFLISLGLLLIFAVVGQIGIDKIGLESESGQYYGYGRCLPAMGITIAITCAVIGIVFLVVRCLPVKGTVLKVVAWILGLIMAGWMIFCACFIIYRNTEIDSTYGVAGLWIAYVDRLEEERMVWSKSHWFGHGDNVYKYSYDEFLDAHNNLSPGNEVEEPYNSILEERYKQESVFKRLYSDTMINVLSYFYGKWVWLVYSLMALCSVIFAISLLPLVSNMTGKLLYCSALVVFAIITLLPVFNGCALVYDSVAGPIFTGIGRYYREYGAFFTGPALGVLVGLIYRKNDTDR